MAKILWISDAGVPTGFAHVTHSIGERLAAMGHEIHVLAIGWQAENPYEGNLKLYRAEAGPAHTYHGYDRTLEMVRKIKPDVIVVNEDAPMVLARLVENRWDPTGEILKSAPIIAYMPADGHGMPKSWRQLKQITTVVPYTEFGAQMWDVTDYVPHGIDEAFRALSADEKAAIREQFNIKPETFVIGRVDTNSGRKDWGATWRVIQRAFDMGLPAGGDETIALFHTTLREPHSGVDFPSIVSRGRGKFAITNEKGWPIEDLNAFFNIFDVFLTTTRGEGWGLNIAQALACGIPVIATDCSSIPEVVGPGGLLYDGVATMTNPYGVDLVLADTESMAEGLLALWNDPARRLQLGDAGRSHVQQYTWDAAAASFNEIISGRLAQT